MRVKKDKDSLLLLVNLEADIKLIRRNTEEETHRRTHNDHKKSQFTRSQGEK